MQEIISDSAAINPEVGIADDRKGFGQENDDEKPSQAHLGQAGYHDQNIGWRHRGNHAKDEKAFVGLVGESLLILAELVLLYEKQNKSYSIFSNQQKQEDAANDNADVVIDKAPNGSENHGTSNSCHPTRDDGDDDLGDLDKDEEQGGQEPVLGHPVLKGVGIIKDTHTVEPDQQDRRTKQGQDAQDLEKLLKSFVHDSIIPKLKNFCTF